MRSVSKRKKKSDAGGYSISSSILHHSLVRKIKNCSFHETIGFLSEGVCSPIARNFMQRRVMTSAEHSGEDNSKRNCANSVLAPNLRREFDNGCGFLLKNQNWRAKIDDWRLWKPGTTEVLAEHGLVSLPNGVGKGIAFAVLAPKEKPKNDYIQYLVGFHLRHVEKWPPKQGGRWEYFPSITCGDVSIGGYPFILGGGHLRSAIAVFVFEGQWDAICLVSNVGWLAHDTSWPDGFVVFGMRGKTNVSCFLECYIAWIPLSALIFVFPDKDGYDYWRTKLAIPLRNGGFKVLMYPVLRDGCKDVTDVMGKISHPYPQSSLLVLIEKGLAKGGVR
jgi:hypothetical protein